MRAEFKYPGGKVAEFDFPETQSKAPPSYLVGIKKGGSTLMAKVMRDIAPFSEKTVFEYPAEAFRQGLPGTRTIDDLGGNLRKPGYVFGVFRWLPENDLIGIEAIQNGARACPILLLLRDPRDVLVSLFYSDVFSHPIPKDGPVRDQMLKTRQRALEGTELDAYVLDKAPAYLRHFYRTLQLLALPTTTMLRYEDIIYDKPALVDAVARTMGAKLEPDVHRDIAKRHDKIPSSENKDSHVRQVHPGNYRKKLKPETIDQLNDRFGAILTQLRYAF